MKKFILLIPSMNNGGAERVMATIANNLCTEHKVQIVTMTDTESFYSLDENVAITGLGQNVNRHNKLTLLFSMATGGIKAFFSLKKKINIEKPDAVLSFLQSANMMAILLKMFGGRFRLVVSERCAPEERDFFNRFFEKYFYSKADVIVCQSEKVINFFREKDRKKITLIPNPIAASAIPPRFEGKRRHTIVGVGRLSDQKNFEMLINAFSALPDKFSDYTLEIYGSGPFEERLKTLIEKKGLTGKAALMGVKKNVMHYISDVALYVMSSNYEGFPNALAEAMATGIPVISTDFPTGVASDIVKKENGIVIPVGDENALVSAIEKMLSKEEQWESMSIENRKLLDTLSENDIMKKWEQVLCIN